MTSFFGRFGHAIIAHPIMYTISVVALVGFTIATSVLTHYTLITDEWTLVDSMELITDEERRKRLVDALPPVPVPSDLVPSDPVPPVVESRGHSQSHSHHYVSPRVELTPQQKAIYAYMHPYGIYGLDPPKLRDGYKSGAIVCGVFLAVSIIYTIVLMIGTI
jgi:hypothetical protein